MISYEVPTKYGYLSKAFLDEQRLSSTYDEEAFARESLSINSMVDVKVI